MRLIRVKNLFFGYLILCFCLSDLSAGCSMKECSRSFLLDHLWADRYSFEGLKV